MGSLAGLFLDVYVHNRGRAYCEVDTLAMVMVYEALLGWLG